MDGIDLLFVYGTLRRTAQSRVHGFLKDNVEFIGGARFQGILYDIGDYPGAISSSNSSDTVLGELYRMKHPPTLLKTLDHYEECSTTFAQPTEFKRVAAPIVCDGGTTVTAWIYLFNRSIEDYRRIECGDYISYKKLITGIEPI